MDKRYEVYCLVDEHFYDPPSRVEEPGAAFAADPGAPPDGWLRIALDHWQMLHPADSDLPGQGWKVHASASLADANRILEVVWAYCVPRRISFKFLRDLNAVLLANAKYADRGSSGKFVTIYPRDLEACERLLTELAPQLQGLTGPYILSDLRWGTGPLYVRYGGFAERYCMAEGGRPELAIEQPDGTLVPDRREPVFRTPDWVDLPAFLQPHLDARNNVTVGDLPYRFTQALHFSNGGGIYLAEDLRDGSQVVLKEARPYAGLDMDGTDAVERQRREARTLQRLEGLAEIPSFRDTFTVGEHHFLAMDLVAGEPLRSVMVEKYPLVNEASDPEELAEYTRWALDVVARVEALVAAIHERDVVIGDLHPFNVLVRDDGTISMIDFEIASSVAEGRRQTMAEPGFAAPRGRTGFDLDRYALACLRLFMFLPLTTLFAIDRNKARDLADVIAGTFPVPREFLDDAVEVIIGTANPPGIGVSWPEPDADGWQRARESMTDAILRSATPQRDDRLFPGDISQFSTGALDLAHGAAGVLYALDMLDVPIDGSHREWLLERALDPEPGRIRLGCYDGLHGVAMVLDRLGHRAEARKLFDLCAEELTGRLDLLGLDLWGGLSGVGLTLLHTTDLDPELRSRALEIGALVADRVVADDDTATVSGGAHPRAGLLRGSAGPALLLIRLYESTGDERWLDAAATALRQDLRRCYTRGDGSVEVNEGWRTMPYLAEGSAGIGLVLDDFLHHREDPEFAAMRAGIAKVARAQLYVEPGLFSGRAGMVLALSRGHAPGRAIQDPMVAEQIRRLGWHVMSYRGKFAFPGEELLRLSMDLATGTAGVLLAMGSALHPQPVHLPFLPQEDGSTSLSDPM